MLKFLLEKEFKQFLRNKGMVRIVLLMPCIMMLLLPWAANMEIRNVNISVVDSDHTPTSARLINKVAASRYYTLTDLSSSYNDALESVGHGTAEIVLEIPPQFERSLVRDGVAEVMITANAVNATNAMLASGYLGGIVADYATELRTESGAMVNGTGGAMISVEPQLKYNPAMDYKAYMVPALMVMLLTIICGFMPALNIVSEKEKGTIEQINVTPVSKTNFILAKLIPYWIIGFLVLTLCFGIAYLIYGLWPTGSLVTAYLGALVYVLVISGLGLLISNNSATMQQAMFMMFFFMIVFILLSGLFTPIESMPEWAQTITIFNPLRYFIILIRSIYLKGSGMMDLLPELAALSIFAVVSISWAVLSYRKSS